MNYENLTLDRIINKYNDKSATDIKNIVDMIFDERFPESYISSELSKINKNKRKLLKLQ